ncbi:MAG: hypothetical protein MUD14_23480 [Hydrococcus sp. Prado102]|jgi:phenylacetate-CoA ligase|nr:hypothetical protein [Hydrococcus sp. Prado102]
MFNSLLDLSDPQRLRELLQAASCLSVYRDRFDEVELDKACWTKYSDEQLFSAFLRLRPLKKDELRKSPAQFLNQVDKIAYRGVTSGTTDRALIYFRDTLWNQKRRAAIERFLSWWGIDGRIPVININSRLFPLREVDYSLTGIVDSELLQWISYINSQNAIVIRGFPSRLCELALLLPRTLPSIVAVICTGELLFPHQRRLLQDTFLAPVIDEYGSQECGIYGFSCPSCNTIHIDTERCFVETENQLLIVTDLYSDCMPLLRYYNGDRAELVRGGNCQHGSVSLKLLGREEDESIRPEIYPLCSGVSYYRALPTPTGEIAIGYLSHTPDAIAQQELKTTLAPILPSDKTIYWQRFEFPQDFYRATLIDAGESEVMSNVLLLSEMTSDKKARALLDIFNSRRWIFYRLPNCLKDIVTQLEKRSDRLDGESSQVIDRTILLMKVLANNADIQNTVEIILTRHRASIHAGNANSLYLDLFAISLFLPGLEPFAELSGISGSITVDSISYRLIFAIVRQAIQNARIQANPPSIARLTPLLPLFVSDLDMYGSKALLGILVHWAILLGNFPKELVEDLTISRPTQLLLRENFLWGFTEAGDRNSIDLSCLDTAELLEIAIQLVISNTPIEPSSLLKAIQRHQQPNLIGAMRFVPFMRFLAERFLEVGEREKAYSCLLVSRDISDMQEAFEFSTRSYNFKQKIFW